MAFSETQLKGQLKLERRYLLLELKKFVKIPCRISKRDIYEWIDEQWEHTK